MSTQQQRAAADSYLIDTEQRLQELSNKTEATDCTPSLFSGIVESLVQGGPIIGAALGALGVELESVSGAFAQAGACENVRRAILYWSGRWYDEENPHLGGEVQDAVATAAGFVAGEHENGRAVAEKLDEVNRKISAFAEILGFTVEENYHASVEAVAAKTLGATSKGGLGVGVILLALAGAYIVLKAR